MAPTKRDGLSRVQRAALARDLKEKGGLLNREIAEKLDISLSYVGSLLADPDGRKEAARKERYRGTCIDCGGPTTYPFKGRKSQRCLKCAKAHQYANRIWTRERIIADIQRWDRLHGRPPTATEWLYYRSPEGKQGTREWPHVVCVQKEFGSWSNALEAAGFERRTGYARTDEWKAKVTKWPKERILKALQEWAAAHNGEAPLMRDWIGASPDYPGPFTVARKFGSWNNAIREAGLQPWGEKAVSRISAIEHLVLSTSNGSKPVGLPSFEERGEGRSLMEVVRDLGKEKT